MSGWPDGIIPAIAAAMVQGRFGEALALCRRAQRQGWNREATSILEPVLDCYAIEQELSERRVNPVRKTWLQVRLKVGQEWRRQALQEHRQHGLAQFFAGLFRVSSGNRSALVDLARLFDAEEVPPVLWSLVFQRVALDGASPEAVEFCRRFATSHAWPSFVSQAPQALRQRVEALASRGTGPPARPEPNPATPAMRPDADRSTPALQPSAPSKKESDPGSPAAASHGLSYNYRAVLAQAEACRVVRRNDPMSWEYYEIVYITETLVQPDSVRVLDWRSYLQRLDPGRCHVLIERTKSLEQAYRRATEGKWDFDE